MDGKEGKPAPSGADAGDSPDAPQPDDARPVDDRAADAGERPDDPTTEHPTAADTTRSDTPSDGRPGGNGSGSDAPLVLGGAAAAEGRTTGPLPRIAGPAAATARPAAPAAGAETIGGGGRGSDSGSDSGSAAELGGGRHFRAPAGGNGDDGGQPGRPRWALALAALPVVALALFLGAWAIDTAALSGQVQRNVEVAGRPVGGLGEESLPDVMTDIADEVMARPVTIVSGDKTYETTAGKIGLALDEEATADAALDAGRKDSLVTRPFAWAKSFFSPRDVAVRYTVSEPTVTAHLLELQGGDVTKATNPTITLTEQGWVAVPGKPGRGIDSQAVVDQLPEAAATRRGAIEIEAGPADVAPTITDERAQEVANQANQYTAGGLELTAGDTTKTVPPEQLRTWIGPTTESGDLELAINGDAVNQALPQVFADLTAEPRNATVTLTGNGPTVTPSQQGVTCCGDDSAGKIWTAMTEGQPGVELTATVMEPELTTDEVEGLGIKQPVCGNNAWRDGVPTTAGPGFTTYYDPGQARVTNIHRIADIVDGTLVLPGETFSMNGTVGPRTTDKGFVLAGAIANGEHVDEVGGGVSQFATTTFNAAYFCGLDITTYQAHSEYFTRYPKGREATMGYPAPDLAFLNDTPYGILIDTSYTSTSVTVTLWSTPYASGAQTGTSESPSGKCTVVTTTRTITYPDRPTATDTFRATYRPGPGEPC